MTDKKQGWLAWVIAVLLLVSIGFGYADYNRDAVVKYTVPATAFQVKEVEVEKTVEVEVPADHVTVTIGNVVKDYAAKDIVDLLETIDQPAYNTNDIVWFNTNLLQDYIIEDGFDEVDSCNGTNFDEEDEMRLRNVDDWDFGGDLADIMEDGDGDLLVKNVHIEYDEDDGNLEFDAIYDATIEVEDGEFDDISLVETSSICNV